MLEDMQTLKMILGWCSLSSLVCYGLCTGLDLNKKISVDLTWSHIELVTALAGVAFNRFLGSLQPLKKQ